MNTDRISGNNKVAIASAKRNKSKGTLSPTQQQPGYNTGNRSKKRNQPAFKQKDANDERVVGSKIAQCQHILPLIQNEHGKGANHIEARNDQNER